MNKTGSKGRRGGWARRQIRVADEATTHRAVEGTAIGNFMEWYDFGLLGYLATTLAQIFFPGHGSGGLIATFGTMAAAFVARPLGGFLFGPLGDRVGRKQVLITTMVLMSVATTATGLLPTYNTIGIWAPILLIAVRVLQGLSTGGEYVGAMTYVDEHAADRRRGLMAGFLPLGTLSGFVVGAAVVTGLRILMPTEDMLSWGWRIPFLVGAPFGIVAIYLRKGIEKSPDYEEMDKGEQGAPAGRQFKDTVVQQWKPLLLCVCLELSMGVTAYMLTGYLPTYLEKTARLPSHRALAMILVVLVILLAVVVFVARLSDYIGVKPVMWAGCGVLIAGSLPAFMLMRSGGGYPAKFVGVLLVGVALLCFKSTEPSTLPALFPTSVRYGALSVGYNISASAFGGTTPLIAQLLVSGTGDAMMPAYMLVFAGLVGAVTLIFTPEVAGRRLPGSAPAVKNEQEARELAERRHAE